MARGRRSPSLEAFKQTSDGADFEPRLSAGYCRWIYQAFDSRLKTAARRDVVRPAFKPGSRFVREYHGVTQVVEVNEDGRFVWNEQSYKSLSHTARAITGYNVSGFKFFGVST